MGYGQRVPGQGHPFRSGGQERGGQVRPRADLLADGRAHGVPAVQRDLARAERRTAGPRRDRGDVARARPARGRSPGPGRGTVRRARARLRARERPPRFRAGQAGRPPGTVGSDRAGYRRAVAREPVHRRRALRPVHRRRGGRACRWAVSTTAAGCTGYGSRLPARGTWTYVTTSTARSLDGLRGTVEVRPPGPGNHGPVAVADRFHFAHRDGTRFVPIGTTCYAWTHQSEALQERTLAVLAGLAVPQAPDVRVPQVLSVQHQRAGQLPVRP